MKIVCLFNPNLILPSIWASNPLSSNLERLPSSRTLSSSDSAKVSIQALSGTSLEASGVELQEGKIDACGMMHISDLFWSIPILSACGMNLKDPSTNHPPTASMLTLGTSASVAASSGLAFSRVLCCSGRKVGKGWEWVGKVIKWGPHGTLCLGSVPFRLHITTVTFPCSPRMYIVEGVHRQSLSLLMNQRIGLQFLRLGPELTQTGESNRISCVWLQGNVHSKKDCQMNIQYTLLLFPREVAFPLQRQFFLIVSGL